MVKITTILTGRYKKVLKKGNHDKIKLLFRSLAVFDRRASVVQSEKSTVNISKGAEQQESTFEEEMLKKSRPAGFTVDESMNDDDEEEDDDGLALAALDSLDAIEVFKQDQKMDRKIHHAVIPANNFKQLIMLMLLYAGLKPMDNLSSYSEGLEQRLSGLEGAAAAVIAQFEPEPQSGGIRYRDFVKAITTTSPWLFEPLNALFEHFLFSQNINLSKQKGIPLTTGNPRSSPIYAAQQDVASRLLSDTLLSQLSLSVQIAMPTGTPANIFYSGARLNQIYSMSSHGTSMSSFSRQVLSWQSATLLMVSGTAQNSSTTITIGAYLPEHWKEPTRSTENTDPAAPKACMFQLQPRHAVFPAYPYNKTIPISHFSNSTGIALGCVIPPKSRTNTASQMPILGPVSLIINSDMSSAIFQHDGNAGTGAFQTDPLLEEAQRDTSKHGVQGRKTTFDIDALEIWGISFLDESGEDEVTRQKKRLAWEEAEAARRAGVNFGGDKDGARALLEMAGLVGDKAGNRSGGSMN